MTRTSLGMWYLVNTLRTNEPMALTLADNSKTWIYSVFIGYETVDIKRGLRAAEKCEEPFITRPLTMAGVLEAAEVLNAALVE